MRSSDSWRYVDRNRLLSAAGWSFFCDGLFSFCLASPDKTISLPGFFDTSSNEQILNILLPVSWSSGEKISDDEKEEILLKLESGISFRGFKPLIIDLEAQDLTGRFNNTLKVIESIKRTEGGKMLDKNSSSGELDDSERYLLWKMALQKYVEANRP